MEFGSIGLATPSQTTVVQNSAASPPQGTTLATNPEKAVSPATNSGGAENELRRDSDRQQADSSANSGGSKRAPDDLQPTSRRTTLNFDSEQNRIFLEVIDKTTDKVIERIPSETLVALIEKTVKPLREPASQERGSRETADTTV